MKAGSSLKRDSLAAELERDPQLSTAKRLARKTTLNTHLSQSALDRELAALRSSHAALEAKLKDRDVQITRLEKDNEYLTSREAEEQEEREREVGEMQGRLENVEEELRNVRRLVAEVEGERDDALDERDALERAKEGTVADLQAQVDTMTGQVEHYQSELSECHAQAEANGRLVQSLREQVDTLTEERGRLVGSRNDDAGARVVREELARQTKYIRNLESKNLKLTSEVTSLRERMMSVEVLREEKRAMEKKLGQLDAMRARTVELEAQLEAAEKERKNWASKAAMDFVPAHDVLADLRLQHATLLEEHGVVSAQLNQRTIALQAAEQREFESKDSVADLKNQINALKQSVDRRNRAKAMDEREIGFLKALVASYKAEEFVSTSATSPIGASEHQSDPKDASRIEDLEATLAEYKAANKTLLAQLDTMEQNPIHTASSSRAAKDEELAKERAKKEKLQAELEAALADSSSLTTTVVTHTATIDSLEQQLFELSGEIAGGRHVPPNTRVLCFKDNPMQQYVDLRQEAMDKLKGENEALMQRLFEVEARLGARGPAAGGSGVGDGDGMDVEETMLVGSGSAGAELVPRKSWETEKEMRQKLEEELKQREKRILRLKEIFQSKSTEFRACVTSIFGVKLAFYPNGNVRVTSMYDLNATFVFQPLGSSKTSSDTANLQLVAQGELNPEDVTDLMGYWLGSEQCMPGFMAAMTLQCYETWKKGGGQGEVA